MPLDWQNIKAAVIGAALGLLAGNLTGCTPQQTASYMPLMSYGTSMSSQAANLYFEQQRMQQQAELQRQQQELLDLQQRH